METSPPKFQPLPPQRINCKWWKRGYCFRGDKCYFLHDEAMAGVDQTPTRGAGSSLAAEPQLTETRDPTPSAEQCGICLEVPVVYGLLIHCDHVFCLECIRNWRSSNKNRGDDDDDEDDPKAKDITKSCPMCRMQSDFVIPSSVFPTPPPRISAGNGSSDTRKNAHKDRIVDAYLSRLKQIPCRYFEKGVSRWYQKKFGCSADSAARPEPAFKPICFFANECHYAHTHPVTSEPYLFSADEIQLMKQKRDKQRTHDTLSSTTSHDSDEETGLSDYYGDLENFYAGFDDFDMDSDDDGFMDECMHQAMGGIIDMSLHRSYLE